MMTDILYLINKLISFCKLWFVLVFIANDKHHIFLPHYYVAEKQNKNFCNEKTAENGTRSCNWHWRVHEGTGNPADMGECSCREENMNLICTYHTNNATNLFGSGTESTQRHLVRLPIV